MLKLKGIKMGTVRGGEIKCDRCGVECRSLYGFAMTVDRVSSVHNEKVKEIVGNIDKKYGKHDFLLCWDCTIQMMGILSIQEKKDADKDIVTLKKEKGSK